MSRRVRTDAASRLLPVGAPLLAHRQYLCLPPIAAQRAGVARLTPTLTRPPAAHPTGIGRPFRIRAPPLADQSA